MRFLSSQFQICLALLSATAFGCSKQDPKSMFADTDQSEFKVGQVWKYNNRTGEESSTLVILKVESAQKWNTIVHVGVIGLRVKTAHGTQDILPHLPFAEAAVKKSVTTKVSDKGPLTDFESGYKLWREAATAGKGGVFTISVGEAVATVEEGLSKAQAR